MSKPPVAIIIEATDRLGQLHGDASALWASLFVRLGRAQQCATEGQHHEARAWLGQASYIEHDLLGHSCHTEGAVKEIDEFLGAARAAGGGS